MKTQAFEKYPALSESIQFAASTWKIQDGWTNHLEQINNVIVRLENVIGSLEKENEYLTNKLNQVTRMNNL